MRCSCKTKERQQQHKKTSHTISNTHTERKNFMCGSQREYPQKEKIKFALKRGLKANMQCDASTSLAKT